MLDANDMSMYERSAGVIVPNKETKEELAFEVRGLVTSSLH